MYIARIYERIIDRKRLYNTKLEKVPTPEFFVLYNGKAQYPDHAELKLTDAFKNADDLREKGNFPLELIVQVFNINHGRNPEMLRKSENLHGYSFLIEKIREYERAIPKEETLEKTQVQERAMTDAIVYCINHDILI
jgi:hypothetical protein